MPNTSHQYLGVQIGTRPALSTSTTCMSSTWFHFYTPGSNGHCLNPYSSYAQSVSSTASISTISSWHRIWFGSLKEKLSM